MHVDHGQQGPALSPRVCGARLAGVARARPVAGWAAAGLALLAVVARGGCGRAGLSIRGQAPACRRAEACADPGPAAAAPPAPQPAVAAPRRPAHGQGTLTGTVPAAGASSRAVSACLRANGPDPAAAAADARDPQARGALLAACRTDPTYSAPSPPVSPPSPLAQTCTLDSGSTAWVCGPTGQGQVGATPPVVCPAPLTGRITGMGNRVLLTITVTGPNGSENVQARLDTGGINTMLPDYILQEAGYRPYAQTYDTGIVAGAVQRDNLYRVPGAMFSVLDQGREVPLATGLLTVTGTRQGGLYSLGPDLFFHGASFEAGDGQWVLSPACGGAGTR